MKNPCKPNEIWDSVKKKCVPIKDGIKPLPNFKGNPSDSIKKIPNFKGTTTLKDLNKLKKGGLVKSKKK